MPREFDVPMAKAPHPTRLQIVFRVEDYRLLACLGSLERTARLLEWTLRSSALQYAGTARCLLRHFPDRQDLEQALTTSRQAGAWAAFTLDRPPGRLAVLKPPAPPALDDSKNCRTSAPARRAALNALLPLLERFEADPTLELAARLEARRLCTGSLRGGLESPLNVRYRTHAAIRSLNLWFTSLQDACHLVQAIGEGWFRANRKLRDSAQRLGQVLPESGGLRIRSADCLRRASGTRALD